VITRLRTQPIKADYWEDTPFLPNLTVYDNEDATFTGLVDEHERPIYSFPDKQPIGFTTRLS
jgi:hypothetical protein